MITHVFEFNDHQGEVVEVELCLEELKQAELEALISHHQNQALYQPYKPLLKQLTNDCWLSLVYKDRVGCLDVSITTSRKLFAPRPLRDEIIRALGYTPAEHPASMDDGHTDYQIARYVLPVLKQMSFLGK